MDWLQRMNGVMDYIEDHLTGDIDFAYVAKLAYCSTYHFHKMFSFITDVPLSEYIRRRRLTMAAFDLLNSKIKIVDIALKYGYDSPTAFTRAFQHIHGVTPSAARDLGVPLKAYPRMSFHISIKGDVFMNYRIEQRPAFSVVGVKVKVNHSNGENMIRIPQFWQETNASGLCEKIAQLSTGEPTGVLGVCADMYDDNTFDYYIAATTDKEPPADMIKKEIPAATYAIFESEGPLPDALQNVWKRIYSEWLPASGYEHAMQPELEVYLDGDSSSPTYKCEVWIPVVKKSNE